MVCMKIFFVYTTIVNNTPRAEAAGRDRDSDGCAGQKALRVGRGRLGGPLDAAGRRHAGGTPAGRRGTHARREARRQGGSHSRRLPPSTAAPLVRLRRNGNRKLRARCAVNRARAAAGSERNCTPHRRAAAPPRRRPPAPGHTLSGEAAEDVEQAVDHGEAVAAAGRRRRAVCGDGDVRPGHLDGVVDMQVAQQA